MGSTVHMEYQQEQLNLLRTRAGKIAQTSDKCYMQQKGIIPLFPHKDPYHVNFSTTICALCKFTSPCSNFNYCSIYVATLVSKDNIM